MPHAAVERYGPQSLSDPMSYEAATTVALNQYMGVMLVCLSFGFPFLATNKLGTPQQNTPHWGLVKRC